MIVADFSDPHIPRARYESEYAALRSFSSQLTQWAYPQRESNEESVWVDVIAYSTFTGAYDATMEHEGSVWINECWDEEECESEAVKDLEYLYEQYLAIDEDDYYLYNDDDYISGLVDLLERNVLHYPHPLTLSCTDGINCFLVISRINPAALYEGQVLAVVNKIKQKGFRIITLDSVEVQQQTVASWVANEPYSRYAHVLSEKYTPHPQAVGSRMVQAVRGGKSGCMSYGMHHVITVDGVLYENNRVGDFVLLKDVFQSSVEVQVRNEWCYPYTVNVACTTGLALRSGDRSFAAYYDPSNDLLAVTVDGVLVNPGYMVFDEFTASVTRHYPSGYDVAVYVLTDNDAFTLVEAFFHGPASVAVYPSPSLQFGVAGLCGTYDGCSADEFYSSSNEFTHDATLFADSWRVYGGGSIFEQPKYIKTDTPFVIRPPFIPSSFVAWTPPSADDDLTDQVLENQEYAAMTCTQQYGDSGGPLYDACVYYSMLWAMHGSEFSGLNQDRFLLQRAIGHVCADMCSSGYSRMGGFTDVSANCSVFCDDQMDDFAGLSFVFPTMEDYRMKLPVATSDNGKEGFVIAPLGGDYLFHVRSSDCCYKSDRQQVIISVECEKQVIIDAIHNLNIKLDEFSIPVVELQANLTSAENIADPYTGVHVMWQFLETPNDVQVELRNQFSLNPSFVPQSVGKYIVQAVATDGCSVSADYVLVDVLCYNRDYVLSSRDSDTMMYTHDVGGGFFEESRLYLEQSCMAPMGMSTEWTEFPWSFVPVSWGVDLSYVSSDTLVLDKEVIDELSNKYTLYWEIDSPIDGVEYTFNYTDYYDDIDDGEYDLYEEYIPSKAPMGVFEWPILRGEALSTLTQTALSHYTTKSGHYHYHYYIKSVECYLTTSVEYVSADDGTFTSYLSLKAENAYHTDECPECAVGTDSLPSWLTADEYEQQYEMAKDNFGIGTGHCPGTYHVQVELQDQFACDSGHDEYLIDVSCVRKPQAMLLTPCFLIKYDYIHTEFPTALVMGADSVVPSYRALEVKWFIYNDLNELVSEQYYNHSTYHSDDADQDVLFDRNVYRSGVLTDLGTIPELYTAVLVITDHCSNDQASIEFGFVGRGEVVAIITAPDIDENDNIVILPETISVTSEGSYTEAADYGATLTEISFGCSRTDALLGKFLSLATQVDDLPHTPCDITQSNDGRDADVDDYFAGDLDITLYVSDQCAYDNDVLTIHGQCDNEWVDDVTFTDGTHEATSFTVTHVPTGDGVGEWPRLVITAVQDGNNDYYWFDVNDGGEEGEGEIYLVGVGNSDSIEFRGHAPGSFDYDVLVYDGCNYDVGTVTVNFECEDYNLRAPSIEWAEDYPTVYLNNLTEYSGTMEVVVTIPNDIVDMAAVFLTTDNECVLIDREGYVIFEDDCTLEGQQTITITASAYDGCNEPRDASLSFTVYCPYFVNPIASIDADVVKWSNGQFPAVCVNGRLTETNKDDWLLSQFGYQWSFTSTPLNSVFQSSVEVSTVMDPVHTETWYHHPYDPTLDPNNAVNMNSTEGVVMDAVFESMTVLVVQEVRTTVLTASSAFDDAENALNADLAACFRPDVPGVYQLMLEIIDDCVVDLHDSVTVTAVCNEPPSISVEEPTDVVVGKRFTFDASISDPDGDDLVYSWNVWFCDTSANSVDLQDYVTNAHAEKASFIPVNAGKHCYVVTASDGCTTVDSDEGTFEATCPYEEIPTPAPTEDFHRIYDYSGVGQLPLSMGVDNLEEDVSFVWQLVGYKPRFAAGPIHNSEEQ